MTLGYDVVNSKYNRNSGLSLKIKFFDVVIIVFLNFCFFLDFFLLVANEFCLLKKLHCKTNIYFNENRLLLCSIGLFCVKIHIHVSRKFNTEAK